MRLGLQLNARPTLYVVHRSADGAPVAGYRSGDGAQLEGEFPEPGFRVRRADNSSGKATVEELLLIAYELGRIAVLQETKRGAS